MIDIGNWTICLDNCSPMTPAVLDGELDKDELKAINILLGEPTLERYKNDELQFSGCWVDYNDNTAWLYGRIAKIFEYANRAYKIPNLVMIENICYFEFTENDFHTFHADVEMGIPFSSRKLALVINLSSSDDYRGGDLEYMTSAIPYKVSRREGTAIVGPAYLLNQITPVTSGKRRQLVAWISAPSTEI